MKKRSPSVEVLRFGTTLGVVLCHINLYTQNNDTSGATRGFFYCAFADMVIPFFFITGFFLFQRDNYAGLMKKTFLKVVLPGVFMVVFYYFLYDAIIRGVPFAESGVLSAAGLLNLLRSILTLRATGVWWYVFAYLWVMLTFPIWKGCFLWLSADRGRERVFLVLTLCLFAVNDLFQNELFAFSTTGLTVLVPCGIFVLWGAILYRHRNEWFSSLTPLRCLLLWLVLTIVRSVLFTLYEQKDIATDLNTFYSCFGLISTAVVTLGVLRYVDGHSAYWTSDAWLPRFVFCAAGFSYEIYLTHPFLLAYANSLGVFSRLPESALGRLYGPLYVSVVIVLCGTALFLVSFGIDFLVRWAGGRIRSALHQDVSV